MKTSILLTLLFITVTASGQNIKKGFKSLEKKDYEKAKEAFQKILTDDSMNVGANFGMAMVLADDKSPLFNIVDAWKYVERYEGKTESLSQDDIDIISEYFLATEVRKTSYPVKKKIAHATEAVQARLIKYIREENDLNAVNEVLKRYPHFKYYENVVAIRNQYEFRKYEKQNTLEGFDEFIRKYPNAAQIDKAKKERDQLAFSKAKATNSISSYNDYIAAYPSSEYIQAAIKLRNAAAYDIAKKQNTLQAYALFIDTYPNALEVGQAKIQQQQLLYEKAKRIKSVEAYNEFISKYPSGAYYVDIFNLKSTELGNKFLAGSQLNNSSVAWARGFDNNGAVESGGAMAVTPNGQIIVACDTRPNDTSFADVWVIKIDASGKMIWNKTVGQAYNDSVAHILVDTSGNVIVVGYTWLSADSASRMGWMFKLGADGHRIWNRDLGKVDIHAVAMGKDNKIYMSESDLMDTVPVHYSMKIYDTDARMVGQRDYTGTGSFNDIKVTPQGQFLVAGSNWVTLMDPKRYIVWEDTIKPPMRITNCSFSLNGEYFFTGTSPSSICYVGYSSQGKRSWKNVYKLTDSTQVCKAASPIGQNNFLVLEQKSDGAKIKSIGADGSVLSVKQLNGGIKVLQSESSSNGTVLLLNNGDLIVVKYGVLNSL